MTKLSKKKSPQNIESNMETEIARAFILIDAYLPKHYTKRVKALLPDVSKGNIRQVKFSKKGPTNIIAALKEIASEEKEIINSR